MEISGYLIVTNDIISNKLLNVDNWQELLPQWQKELSARITVVQTIQSEIDDITKELTRQQNSIQNEIADINNGDQWSLIQNVQKLIDEAKTTDYPALKARADVLREAIAKVNAQLAEIDKQIEEAKAAGDTNQVEYLQASRSIVHEGILQPEGELYDIIDRVEAYEKGEVDAYIQSLEDYKEELKASKQDKINDLNMRYNQITAEANAKLSKLRSDLSDAIVERDAAQIEVNKYQALKTKYGSLEIKLDQNKMFLDGKRTSREDANEYIIRLSARYKVTAQVPVGDAEYTTYKSDGTNVSENKYTTQSYEKYTSLTRGIKVTCDENMDILTSEKFEILSSNETLVPVNADALAGLSIVNLIDLSDIQYGDVKKVIDTALDEIKQVQLPDLDWANMFKRKGGNYADIYLSPDFSVITNGYVTTEEALSDTGVKATKQVWKGDYPLDRLIYAIQNNLDILMANQRIKGDVYGNLYATLMAQAIQSATVLEQARLQAYEQASQFQIKSMIEYYLGAINAKLSVIKTLAEVQTQFLQKAIYQAQIKLYNVQTQGFKANNINKLFTAQLDGASTAYTAGTLDIPPACYNNADLMGLYTDLSNNLSVL